MKCFVNAARSYGSGALIVMAAALVGSADADEPNPSPELHVRVYQLGALTDVLPTFSYDTALPTTVDGHAARQVFGMPASSGGGLGGGGQGGGGGYFSVGPGTHMSSAVHVASRSPVVGTDFSQVIDAISTMIEPESWRAHGGEAEMNVVGDTLLIRQTDANHIAITDLLMRLETGVAATRTVGVDIWWLRIKASGTSELKTFLGESGAAADKLNELCAQQGGRHGTLKTCDGQSANIVSGVRMPVIVSETPVVGTQAIGAQPTVVNVNIGLMAEITPRTLSDGRIRVTLRSILTKKRSWDPRESADSVIDRLELENEVLETTVDCTAGHPVIAGSMAGADTNADESLETVVVLCVNSLAD